MDDDRGAGDSRATNRLRVRLPNAIELTAEGSLAVTLAAVLIGALIVI